MSDLGLGWIDSHCHLADPRLTDVGLVLRQAQDLGITGFVMAGVDPEDWQRQLALSQVYPQVISVLGLHPYFVAAHSLQDCEQALDQLARLIPQTSSLIGEMGLDLRTHIAGDSQARQIEIFEAQLEMAQVWHRPVVLHIVRAFSETERIFQVHGAPARGGFVHAFNGSAQQAESYLQWGLLLSIGGAIVRADNHRLRQAVTEIPLDRLLIESDTPDQAPEGWQFELNAPGSILQVAECIANLKAVTRDEVLARSKQNMLRLMANDT